MQGLWAFKNPKSSFGDLNNNRRELGETKKILGSKTGNIQIFPICDKDFKLPKQSSMMRCKPMSPLTGILMVWS